ncbi:eg:bacr7a4.3 protein-related [Holotrichia oblita]|uniref:Eg:bacr7a4.3 protein-related n=1 Tax=Holotrichia oblita TaxID=644536 RepID=A0ACB9SZH6_HOLOL|nr:eg:bacr7a4.3 protein-related [Holotrichia oblita]
MYSSKTYLAGLLLVTLQSVVVSQYEYEGELCFHQKKGVDGVCKILSNCPVAITDIRKGVYPENCGFQGTAVIVCCPQESKPKKPVGEKCKEACKKYEELGYRTEYAPVLSAGAIQKIEICPWQPTAVPTIIDGIKTTRGEFGHMALMGYGTVGSHEWQCGGTLISEKFVLTAAHCLYGRLGEPTLVRLGDTNYTDPTDDQYVQQIRVKKLHVHPDYNGPVHYHDIALLELDQSVKLNQYVKPACLYTKTSETIKEALITGWGTTENGTTSDYLLKAGLTWFEPQTCNRTFVNDKRKLPRGIDADIQMCYGSITSRKDTCQGDSGGPLQIYAGSDYFCTYYVFGVTSFGELCYHNTKKVSGQCKLLSNCPDAIKDLKNRIYPQHCGFIRDSVIVCCLETKQIPTIDTVSFSENVHVETTTSHIKPVIEIQNTLPPVSTTTPSSEAITETDSPLPKPEKKRPGERSKYWCENFEDLAFKTEISPILFGKPQMIKMGMCPWEVIPQVSGGVQTKLGEFPHMALLKYKGRSQCGGALVSETFVITAAHCIDTENNVYLKPICLYDEGTIDFERAMVTGWGKTEDDVTSSHLLNAFVSIFSQQSCNQVYERLVPVFPNGIDDDLEICAGSHTSNQDACKIVVPLFLSILQISVLDFLGTENNCTCVLESACKDYTSDFIGLVDVKIRGIPWTVLILHKEIESNKSVYKCGGSLIHPRVILTAAHCISEESNGYWIIRAGEWNTKMEDEPLPHQDRLVEDVILHPEYNPDSLKNDVALLYLSEPFQLAGNIKIICLPRSNWEVERIKCIAAGWGKNAFKKGKHSTILKKIEIPLVPKNDCVKLLRQTRLGKYYNLHQSFICAGGELNRDTCKGDGGSPLVCPISKQNGRYFQAGIVSWGIGCGENNTPGVYVNVALFITWIDSELSAKNIDMNSYKF